MAITPLFCFEYGFTTQGSCILSCEQGVCCPALTLWVAHRAHYVFIGLGYLTGYIFSLPTDLHGHLINLCSLLESLLYTAC